MGCREYIKKTFVVILSQLILFRVGNAEPKIIEMNNSFNCYKKPQITICPFQNHEFEPYRFMCGCSTDNEGITFTQLIKVYKGSQIISEFSDVFVTAHFVQLPTESVFIMDLNGGGSGSPLVYQIFSVQKDGSFYQSEKLYADPPKIVDDNLVFIERNLEWFGDYNIITYAKGKLSKQHRELPSLKEAREKGFLHLKKYIGDHTYNIIQDKYFWVILKHDLSIHTKELSYRLELSGETHLVEDRYLIGEGKGSHGGPPALLVVDLFKNEYLALLGDGEGNWYFARSTDNTLGLLKKAALHESSVAYTFLIETNALDAANENEFFQNLTKEFATQAITEFTLWLIKKAILR